MRQSRPPVIVMAPWELYWDIQMLTRQLHDDHIDDEAEAEHDDDDGVAGPISDEMIVRETPDQWSITSSPTTSSLSSIKQSESLFVTFGAWMQQLQVKTLQREIV